MRCRVASASDATSFGRIYYFADRISQITLRLERSFNQNIYTRCTRLHIMVFESPYRGIDWANVEHHLAQFHLHEPRNKITNDTSVHQPDVNVKKIPPHINKNDISPRSSPRTLIEKYHRVGYTVLSITEHEYFVNGTEYSNESFHQEMEETSWPWSDWGITPEDIGMVGLEGTELGGTLDELDELHHIISLNNSYGHGRFEPLESVVDNINKRGGISFLAHPGKYYPSSAWENYKSSFENNSSLLGMEIFNASDRYPGRGIWDKLLEHFGSNRPIWATGGDDYHARARETGEKRFDKSRNVLLLSELTKRNVINALKKGQYYVQYNSESYAPFIESIKTNGDSITIHATDANEIKWISEGQEIVTGGTVLHDHLSGKNYVRAEIHGQEDAVTCTQPIYLD